MRLRVAFLVCALVIAAGPAAVEAAAPALVISEGSVARDQVVAIGRDLVVQGEALADVAAINGSVLVSGKISGDLILLGGDARLETSAKVGGDVLVLGGTLTADPGVEIGGRAVAYPSVGAAWITLVEGPALGLDPFSPVVLGVKMALLTSWLVVCLLLFATAGSTVIATSEVIAEQPGRDFLVGLTGVLALTLTTLFFSSFVGSLVGVPLMMLAVGIGLVLKIWGMVAIFHALGGWLAQRVLRRRLQPLNSAVVGLCVLGLVKLVPFLGVWVWSAATLVGIGATLATKFGRNEAWFGPAAVGGV